MNTTIWSTYSNTKLPKYRIIRHNLDSANKCRFPPKSQLDAVKCSWPVESKSCNVLLNMVTRLFLDEYENMTHHPNIAIKKIFLIITTK